MNEKKRCSNCIYFSLYYTRGCLNYFPKEVGNCLKHGKTVSQKDCCEKWKSTLPTKEYRKERALKAIPAIRDQLDAIEKTLQNISELETLNEGKSNEN